MMLADNCPRLPWVVYVSLSRILYLNRCQKRHRHCFANTERDRFILHLSLWIGIGLPPRAPCTHPNMMKIMDVVALSVLSNNTLCHIVIDIARNFTCLLVTETCGWLGWWISFTYRIQTRTKNGSKVVLRRFGWENPLSITGEFKIFNLLICY